MRIAPLLSILVISPAGAQQPAAPAFEVASVKLNHSNSNGLGGMIGIKQGGSLSMRNISTRLLIEIAYSLADYQLSRGPAWTDTAGYDIEAKPDQPVNNDTAILMMQNMLAERFHLKVHHENSTVAGFHLVVDKGGSKLKPSEAQGIGFRLQGPGEIQGPGDTRMLAATLKGLLRVPVEDHTGIDGKYDIQLKWSREDGAAMTPGGLSTPEPTVSIFTALQTQLGLSLEKVSVPIDFLVIDRVERPTEN